MLTIGQVSATPTVKSPSEPNITRTVLTEPGDYISLVQLAGQWTQCIAWDNGTQWNVTNVRNAQSCFKKARKCTHNNKVRATFYSNPVIVNAPYRICK